MVQRITGTMNDEYIEYFEQHLLGRTTAAEKQAFDARLRADAAFAEEFAQFRTAWMVVQVAGEARLRQRLMDIHQAMHGPQGMVLSMRRWAWLSVAASLLVALGITWFFLGHGPSPAELYAEHMQVYPAPDIMRGADGTDDWSRFRTAYAAGEFDAALALLPTVDDAHAPAYLRTFYHGQCELMRPMGDARSAIAHFNEVLLTDNDMHPIARWYMALAALRVNDLALARTQLRALVDGNGYRRDEAQALLRALP